MYIFTDDPLSKLNSLSDALEDKTESKGAVVCTAFQMATKDSARLKFLKGQCHGGYHDFGQKFAKFKL